MSIATTAPQPPDEQTASSTNAAGLRRIKKGRRLTGESAKQFTVDVIKAYETKSIRSFCEETGRSYGAIHRLLTTNGVTMRPKGYRRKTSTIPTAYPARTDIAQDLIDRVEAARRTWRAPAYLREAAQGTSASPMPWPPAPAHDRPRLPQRRTCSHPDRLHRLRHPAAAPPVRPASPARRPRPRAPARCPSRHPAMYRPTDGRTDHEGATRA